MNELTLTELVEKIKNKMDIYWFIESIDVEFDELVDALFESGTLEKNYERLLYEIDEEAEDE